MGEAFNRLDSSAQKVMQALSVYNRPVSPAAIDYLLQPHLPSIDSALVLNRLVYMHFARRDAGKYYLHSADKEYAFSIIPSSLTPTPLPVGEGQGVRKFTQHDLLKRAADYFAQIRKPRAEWKKLDDLAAQMAEFDLRCVVGDYDTAASVLTEIDGEYLLLWGHYRLTIELHEKLRGKVKDNYVQLIHLNNLGNAYRNIGQVKNSIPLYEDGLKSARHAQKRQAEGIFLGSLGNAHSNLGNIRKAIECYEQSLVILREIGDRRGEGACLGNLGNRFSDLGDEQKAIEFYEQALAVAREIGNRSSEATSLINLAEALAMSGQYSEAIDAAKQSLSIAVEMDIPASYEYGILSEAYLFNEQLENALINAKEAQKFDQPKNNHNVSTLLGIIALRQGDASVAPESFRRAVAQSDEILAKTPDYYSALDAKALALCGLAIADGGRKTEDGGKMIAEAVETFRKARKIAPHAGVVKRVLRLFDELVKCDESAILKTVAMP